MQDGKAFSGMVNPGNVAGGSSRWQTQGMGVRQVSAEQLGTVAARRIYVVKGLANVNLSQNLIYRRSIRKR
jgi:hypothetical protein